MSVLEKFPWTAEKNVHSIVLIEKFYWISVKFIYSVVWLNSDLLLICFPGSSVYLHESGINPPHDRIVLLCRVL